MTADTSDESGDFDDGASGPLRGTPPNARPRRLKLFARRPEVVACAVVVAPLIVAIIRAISRQSIPIGDNALFVIRSRDVFSLSHFPLLGTASSASVGAGTGLNHPGPLLFDLLSAPVTLFGATAGIAIGVGLINIAATVGIAVVGFRIRGTIGSLLATAAAGLLGWTLGSALVVEPWNPHVLILPALLMFIVAAAVSAGDVALLPVLALVGALCLQTHLGYAVIVPAVSVVAIVGAIGVHRRRWRLDPGCRVDDRPRLRRIALITVSTTLIVWIQPIWELVRNGRDGNLAKLLTSGTGDEPTIGARLGTRLMASVVALPSGWGRSSFVSAIPDTGYEPDGITVRPDVAGFLPSVTTLTAAVIVLILLFRRAWRRRDRFGVAVAATAIATLFAGLVTLTVMPIGPLGLRPHQMRWLWAIGPFLLFTVGVHLAPGDVAAEGVDAGPESRPHRLTARRIARPAMGIIISVFAVLNLPEFVQGAGPNSESAAIPVARELARQVARTELDESVVFDPTGSRFGEPYSPVVLAALQQGDQSWFVDDEYLIRQFGEQRRATGDERFRLTVVESRAALSPPPGSQRLAFVSPLLTDEVEELLEGERMLTELIQSFGLLLTPEGEALVASGRYFVALDTILNAHDNAGFLVDSGTVAQLVGDGALVIASEDAELFDRISALRLRVGTDTVAVLVTATRDQ